LDKAKRAGRVRYWVAYYLPGRKLKWESAGFSIDDAKVIEGDLRVQKRAGKLPEMMRGSKLTFAGLSKWHLEQESVKALASYSIIKLKLDKFNAEFGTRPVNTISASDLKNFQTKLQGQGLKPGTVDQDLGKVKAMINAAFLNGKIGADAYRAFKAIKKTLVKGSDVRDRVLTAEEFSRLLTHAEGHTKGILMMAYHTGMRRGEILGLTWDRVDLKNRMIYLEARHTKTKEPRMVPMSAELFKMLQGMPGKVAESGKTRHVFQHKEPMFDIRAGIKKACKAAGIEYGRNIRDGFTLHDLRHAFTTNMRRAGVPEREIMAITGHSSRSTFDRYSKVDEADLRHAIERLEVFSAGITKSITFKKKKARPKPSFLLQHLNFVVGAQGRT
jgi:integrase